MVPEYSSFLPAKDSKGTMMTWSKVTGNTFEGAVSAGADSETEIDFSVKGQKKGTTPDVD